MEYDRYQQNHSLFILAMACLVLSMGLFGFSIYIAPALIWDVHYNIPLFVLNLRETIHLNQEYSEKASAWLVFLLFFIPACVAGFIAYLSSNRLENQVYHIEPEPADPTVNEERIEDLKESTGLGLKIFFLMLLVVIATIFLQWFFSATS